MASPRPSAPAADLSPLIADDETLQKILAESAALASANEAARKVMADLIEESKAFEQERQANAEQINKIKNESYRAESNRLTAAAVAKDQALRLEMLESDVVSTTADCCQLITNLKKIEPHLAIGDLVEQINEASKGRDLPALEKHHSHLEKLIAKYEHLHENIKAYPHEQASAASSASSSISACRSQSFWDSSPRNYKDTDTIYNHQIFKSYKI